MKRISFLIFSAFLLMSCQRKAAQGPAADTMSAIAPPPMGATTYNDELKRELALLDDLVNDRIDQKHIKAVTKGLMEGNKELFSKTHEHAQLVKLFLTLPELVHPKEKLTDNRKKWLKAKLLFLKRRFVEASMLMSEVLKQEPTFIEARNWRARAIFFLGNPDLAVSELKMIVDQSSKDSEARLDALYLIGAIIFESNDPDKGRIKTGIDAWKNYLAHQKSSPELKSEIEASILELNRRLEGQKEPLPFQDPFTPAPLHSAEKNAVFAAFKDEKLLLAEELAAKLLAKNDDKDIAVIKARIFFKTGRLDEAVELFNQITKKHSDYAPGFHYRGMVFMMKGEMNEAVSSWKKAMTLDPVYGQAYNLEQRIAVAEKMTGPTKIESH